MAHQFVSSNSMPWLSIHASISSFNIFDVNLKSPYVAFTHASTDEPLALAVSSCRCEDPCA